MAIDSGFKTQISEAIKSLTEAELLKIGKAIYQGFVEVGSFGDRHRILDGYRDGVKVPIITSGEYYGSLAGAPDDCSVNSCSIDNEYSTKTWRIGDYSCRLDLCIDKLDESFRTFWGMYRQTLEDPSKEPDKKAFIAFFIDQSQKTLRGTLWRVGYHGDVTSANVLINKNNGLWVEAEAGDGHKIPMTLTNGELTGEELYNYFQQAYLYAGSQPWFSESDFKFRVTRKVARTFVTWLNSLKDVSQYNCDCINPDAIVSRRVFAIDNISVFGIPIISHEEEQKAEEFLNAGVTTYKILLIKDDNALFAVETKNHLEQFDMFYDKKDKKIYIDLGAQLGSSIPLDEYVYLTGVTTP